MVHYKKDFFMFSFLSLAVGANGKKKVAGC
jgi:hypothetical protein